MNDKTMVRPPLWQIIVVIASILLLVLFGILYWVSLWSFTPRLIPGIRVSETINLTLATSFPGKENYDPYKQARVHKTCEINEHDNWFEFASPYECTLTSSSIQANNYCGWLDFGTTCVGISVPSIYLESETFKQRLFQAVPSVRLPCTVYLTFNQETNDYTRSQPECSKGRDFKVYDVVIMVINEEWEDFSSFRDRDRSTIPDRLPRTLLP